MKSSVVEPPDFEIDIKYLSSPLLLFISLIPLLSIFGTIQLNNFQGNLLLIILIVIISLIPIILSFAKNNLESLFPLIIFIIAISLLFHVSLVSDYLIGWDIYHEYYISNSVLTNSYWDITLPSNSNGMLSLAIIPVIFSHICGIDLISVFKIIFPFVFSLVPLALYRIFQKQTNSAIAFLSCFFFISYFHFYTGMVALAKQEIAELFLVLLVLLFLDDRMNKINRSILLIVFGISLITSHYGTAYIFVFCLFLVWLLIFFINNQFVHNCINFIFIKIGLNKNLILFKKYNTRIYSSYVLLLFVFMFTWYIFVSSSSSFETLIVHVGKQIVNSIFSEFLDPKSAQGLSILAMESSTLFKITKYLHLFTQFLISIALITIFSSFLKKKNFINSSMMHNMSIEYMLFSLVSYSILISCIIVPNFAKKLSTARFYQITLIFLAPLCIIGGLILLRKASNYFGNFDRPASDKAQLKILSVFFAIFLLFNSGMINELAKDTPVSISYNNSMDYPRFSEQEVIGVDWLFEKRDNNQYILADVNRYVLLWRYQWRGVGFDTSKIRESYVFLGKINVLSNSFRVLSPPNEMSKKEYIVTNNLTKHKDKIYANGNSEIYF
jgi:uncharacterized membrane protein